VPLGPTHCDSNRLRDALKAGTPPHQARAHGNAVDAEYQDCLTTAAALSPPPAPSECQKFMVTLRGRLGGKGGGEEGGGRKEEEEEEDGRKQETRLLTLLNSSRGRRERERKERGNPEKSRRDRRPKKGDVYRV